MITLVVGLTGSGKTTYAKKLASEQSAVVYSIDNWMKALYWQDMPPEPDMKWFVDNQKWYTDRIGRCEDLITNIVLSRAEFGHRSILDLGFTAVEHRKKFIDFYKEHGFEVDTHYLKVDTDTRWSRVEKRNNTKGDTFVMNVDRGMFDYMESIFETPSPQEGANLKVIE